jgi:hypothetical protein
VISAASFVKPPAALPRSPLVIEVADIAGDYYFGDGLGVNCSLHLDKNGSCAFKWHGCEGVYDDNGGTYEGRGDLVVLNLTKPNSREGFQGTATRFYPIQWGKRHYLIADEQMVGFCSRIGRGWRPGSEVNGFYYLRRGDEKVRVSYLPRVPAEFQRYLAAPFSAKVVSVIKSGYFKIDRGKLDGVAVRTMLATEKDGWLWLRVISVSDRTADCVLHTADKRKPRAGTKLQTVAI